MIEQTVRTYGTLDGIDIDVLQTGRSYGAENKILI